MYHLIFDSSTKLMWIGLAKDKKLIDHYKRIAARDHSKYIVDAIDKLLAKNNVKLENIDEIIVGSGPGSYTGLRVSVMVAKMFAYTKKIPLKEVSSILFLTSGYNMKVCGMIDARRNQYFTGIYNNGETIYSDKLILEPEGIELSKKYNAEVVKITPETYKIDVSVIIDNSKIVKDVHSFIPNYLRKTEAERNLE